MRVLIDENCSAREFVARLRSAGHDVETTISTLGASASDVDIAAYAIELNRCIITKDVGDFRSLFSAGKDHTGLMLIYEGRGEMAATPTALVRAVNNVAATYPSLRSFVIVLNQFI